jgi:hypothetical protein
MDNLNENINLYISREGIFDCIKKLKNDKASGEDGIINEYIKSTAHQFGKKVKIHTSQGIVKKKCTKPTKEWFDVVIWLNI